MMFPSIIIIVTHQHSESINRSQTKPLERSSYFFTSRQKAKLIAHAAPQPPMPDGLPSALHLFANCSATQVLTPNLRPAVPN